MQYQAREERSGAPDSRASHAIEVDKCRLLQHVTQKNFIPEAAMVVTATHHAVISLIAGILILIIPRLLNYIVAVYLIITGLLALLR